MFFSLFYLEMVQTPEGQFCLDPTFTAQWNTDTPSWGGGQRRHHLRAAGSEGFPDLPTPVFWKASSSTLAGYL